MKENPWEKKESCKVMIMPKAKKQKAVCMVSGGIDSPVAAAIAARHFEIIPLHFVLYPFYCKGSFELFFEIAKKLKEKTKFKKLIIYPHAEVLSTIMKSGNRKFMCVLCRKSMFKAAEKICEAENAKTIVTGEALAQKASQTLPNMAVTAHGIKYPVLQPLLSFDKTEIEAKSKELGLWGKHVGCCTATPDFPATHANLGMIEKIFNEFGLQQIIDKNFEKVSRIESLDKGGFNHLQEFIRNQYGLI